MQQYFIYLIFILSINTLFPQISDQEVIAKIGSDEITEEEFLARYELTPQVYAGIKGMEEALKKETLYSIISEKLWALEAVEEGLSNSGLIKFTYKTCEEMYVRDALYKEEVLSKVNLTDHYLQEAFRRNSHILQLKYLFSYTKDEIDHLYSQLNKEVPFDSLLAIRPENYLQTEPYYVVYGQMDKKVEDILFNMHIGEFTEPIEAPNGWYIFKLQKIGENLILNSDQAEEERKKVIKVATTTITDSIYKEFYNNFFSDVQAETNAKLFLQLTDEIINSLSDRKQIEKIPDGKEISIKPEDLYSIEIKLGTETLNSIFIEIKNQNLTLKDFIQYFAFETFSVDSIDNNRIKGKLNLIVKKFIEHKLLAQEGYRRGLQFSDEVQQQLNMWRSYYLSNALRNKLLDEIEVTNDELINYFEKKNGGLSTSTDFNSVKNKLMMELKYEKFNKNIIKKTVELANKYSVEINQELFENITVTNTTTVIYRYMGFGGRILAVPMTIPNFEWFESWLNQKSLVP